MKTNLRRTLTVTSAAIVSLAVAQATLAQQAQRKGVFDKDIAPAGKFDLSHWNITLPVDLDKNGKPDSLSVKQLEKYSHPDFFYLNEEGGLTFASPNKGFTTKNTSNTRSELRYMLRGKRNKIKTHDPRNNFAVQVHPRSKKFGSIGGKMEATLKVDHVALNAGNPKKGPAYSVVVGQIHGIKSDNNAGGFNYGNEPLKIYYKKFPGHATGSVFWNYELNLAKDDPKRRDIVYPVWGNDWKNPADPGAAGVALGEEFSYEVNVHENMMYLTFTSPKHGTKKFTKSLISQHGAKGEMLVDDNKYAYGGDSLYFKAGVYNQCSTSNKKGSWYAGCGGTGVWETDKANGDYAQATFSRLVVGDSTAPAE